MQGDPPGSSKGVAVDSTAGVSDPRHVWPSLGVEVCSGQILYEQEWNV